MRFLNSDVSGSGFAEVLVRSDNELAVFIEVGRCDGQDRGECPARLAKQRVGKERCEGCDRCCADEFGSCLVQACEVLWCDGERM